MGCLGHEAAIGFFVMGLIWIVKGRDFGVRMQGRLLRPLVALGPLSHGLLKDMVSKDKQRSRFLAALYRLYIDHRLEREYRFLELMHEA